MKKILILILLLSSICCSKDKSRNKDELIISAAISLKDSMTEIEKLYREVSPDVKLFFNFGSSVVLEQQIQNNAPVDIFISASEKQMDKLSSNNLIIEDSRIDLLHNSIVLISKKEINITNFNNLYSNNIKTIAVGEFKSAPVGEYAYQIFNRLNMYNSISNKLVFAKDVREVLTWVTTGNADVGIVYKTDAAINSDKIKIVIEADTNLHTLVSYPVAIIKSTKNENASKYFINFLQTEKAKNIFIKYGFKLAN